MFVSLLPLVLLSVRAKVDWPNTPIGACAPSCSDVESDDCRECCQTFDHETDWKCGTDEAADCCTEWSAECFWVRSEHNFNHGCKDCGAIIWDYWLAPTGTCPTGSEFLESKTDCENAATILGLDDTTAGDNSHADNPYGCYYKKSTKLLYWGLAGGKNDDDADRVSLCVGRLDDTCFFELTVTGQDYGQSYSFSHVDSCDATFYTAAEADSSSNGFTCGSRFGLNQAVLYSDTGKMVGILSCANQGFDPTIRSKTLREYYGVPRPTPRPVTRSNPRPTPRPTRRAVRLPTRRPTPLVASACENKNGQCPKWASEGECARNPGYMNVNCKQACGLCHCLPNPAEDPEVQYYSTEWACDSARSGMNCEDAPINCRTGARAATWAFSKYYDVFAPTGGTCDFSGTAYISDNVPYPECVYALVDPQPQPTNPRPTTNRNQPTPRPTTLPPTRSQPTSRPTPPIVTIADRMHCLPDPSEDPLMTFYMMDFVCGGNAGMDCEDAPFKCRSDAQAATWAFSKYYDAVQMKRLEERVNFLGTGAAEFDSLVQEYRDGCILETSYLSNRLPYPECVYGLVNPNGPGEPNGSGGNPPTTRPPPAVRTEAPPAETETPPAARPRQPRPNLPAPAPVAWTPPLRGNGAQTRTQSDGDKETKILGLPVNTFIIIVAVVSTLIMGCCAVLLVCAYCGPSEDEEYFIPKERRRKKRRRGRRSSYSDYDRSDDARSDDYRDERKLERARV